MKTINKTKFAIGTSLIVGLALTAGCADSGGKSFAQEELPSGYMNENEAGGGQGAAKKKEDTCGEGKCGDSKKEEKKAMEAKCGEGKCGEGKCGASK